MKKKRLTSPASSSTSLSTPWAAGCCGPKLMVMFFTSRSTGCGLQFHASTFQSPAPSGTYMTGLSNFFISSAPGYHFDALLTSLQSGTTSFGHESVRQEHIEDANLLIVRGQTLGQRVQVILPHQVENRSHFSCSKHAEMSIKKKKPKRVERRSDNFLIFSEPLRI